MQKTASPPYIKKLRSTSLTKYLMKKATNKKPSYMPTVLHEKKIKISCANRKQLKQITPLSRPSNGNFR